MESVLPYCREWSDAASRVSAPQTLAGNATASALRLATSPPDRFCRGFGGIGNDSFSVTLLLPNDCHPLRWAICQAPRPGRILRVRPELKLQRGERTIR